MLTCDETVCRPAMKESGQTTVRAPPAASPCSYWMSTSMSKSSSSAAHKGTELSNVIKQINSLHKTKINPTDLRAHEELMVSHTRLQSAKSAPDALPDSDAALGKQDL